MWDGDKLRFVGHRLASTTELRWRRIELAFEGAVECCFWAITYRRRYLRDAISLSSITRAQALALERPSYRLQD